MNDCIFCKIINKELPSQIIYEDEKVIGFMSKFPIISGHSLIVPKKHYKDFLDMDSSDIKAVFEASQKVGKKLMDKLGYEGFNFANNQGKAAGQEIFHVHFHLIPRKDGDGLLDWQNQDPGDEELQRVAELLKQ